MPDEHPVDRFRRQLTELRTYPPGIVPIPAFLNGTAFFSAAAGLIVRDPSGPLPPFPHGGVMFVGHNLDSEEAFLKRLASGRPHGGPVQPMLTWRNLYRLLTAAGVPGSSCFFTNAYVGLKAGADPTGRVSGTDAPEFTQWCRRFLEDQVACMRPAVIATLGSAARRFVGAMQTELGAWRSLKNPPPEVVDTHLGGCRVAAVPLLHPSGYHGSLGRRRYGHQTGFDAETALLREAAGVGQQLSGRGGEATKAPATSRPLLGR